jgi:DNA-directed RNA polymerase specialized sigma subunit
MKNNHSKYDDLDLTGIIPHELTPEEAEEISQYIERHKAQQKPYDVQQTIVHLLKSGKLSIGEIAECLNVSISRIMAIQADIQVGAGVSA